MFTAGDRASALLAGDAEVAGDAFELLLGDERADLRVGIEPIADPQALAEIGDPADEFVIDP